MLTAALERAIARRIESECALLERTWRGRELPSPGDFFWEPLGKGTPTLWGNAVAAKYREPLLPQLLLTPALIVDMYDDNERDFVSRFGVTTAQFRMLAEEQFVVPMIYLSKGDAWRRYAKHAEVAGIIAAHGRPHNDIVQFYLQKKYRFSEQYEKQTAFFRTVPLTPEDIDAVIKSTHGSLRRDEEAKIPEYLGQRLAYIASLGDASVQSAVLTVRDMYATPGLRASALALLNGAKTLVATKVTAAFGGRVAISGPQLDDIDEAILACSLPEAHSDRVSEPEFAYASTLLDRSNEIRPSDGSRIRWPLSDDEFASFLKVVRECRDGAVARLLLSLQSLLDGTSHDRSLRNYLEREREVEDRLHPFGGLARLAGRVGMHLTDCGTAESMKNDVVRRALLTAGFLSISAEQRLQDIAVKPLFGSEARVLCGDWNTIRTRLRIDRARTRQYHRDP